MRAHALLGTERDAAGRTRVATLRSQVPLLLRLTLPKASDPWTDGRDDVARVCLAAGAAGPLGGDQLHLHVSVGAGSTLVLYDVSATLLLPGPRGAESRLRIDVHVDADAAFIWLPEPVIAARGCRHRTEIRVDLDDRARLLLREELLLGRHGEQPGNVRQRLHIRRGGRTLLHQQLRVGPEAPGFDGPAVTGGGQALGSLLAVEPTWQEPLAPVALTGDAALMPLTGPAALVSALCGDAFALRRTLDEGLALLGLRAVAPPRHAPRSERDSHGDRPSPEASARTYAAAH